MDSRKPEGVTWDFFLSQELGLTEGDDTVTIEDAEPVVRRVAEAMEAAGHASAEDVEESIMTRLTGDDR